MTSTSTKVPMGAPVIGFIGEEVPVVMSGAAAPAPLIATASAATNWYASSSDQRVSGA
jgi:hypothetical protein